MIEMVERAAGRSAQLPQSRRDSSTCRIMVANALDLRGKFDDNLPII
jgi:hypothetical protein